MEFMHFALFLPIRLNFPVIPPKFSGIPHHARGFSFFQNWPLFDRLTEFLRKIFLSTPPFFRIRQNPWNLDIWDMKPWNLDVRFFNFQNFWELKFFQISKFLGSSDFSIFKIFCRLRFFKSSNFWELRFFNFQNFRADRFWIFDDRFLMIFDQSFCHFFSCFWPQILMTFLLKICMTFWPFFCLGFLMIFSLVRPKTLPKLGSKLSTWRLWFWTLFGLEFSWFLTSDFAVLDLIFWLQKWPFLTRILDTFWPLFFEFWAPNFHIFDPRKSGFFMKFLHEGPVLYPQELTEGPVLYPQELKKWSKIVCFLMILSLRNVRFSTIFGASNTRKIGFQDLKSLDFWWFLWPQTV